MIKVLRQTDLPDPVEPATRRWGARARSSMRGTPALSLPRKIGIANFDG